MPNVYFDASYGGIDLLISSIDTEGGRDIAVQSPSRGDRHVLQDRGRKLRSANVSILFIDQPGLAPYLDRYDQFRALVDAGDSQIFSHPLDGSYQARASELRVSADSGTGQVSCTCTIIAENEPKTVFPLGAGVSAAAGLEAVTTASAAADTSLADAGLSSPVPSSCLAAITKWTNAADELDTQEVFLGVASLTQQISDATDALDLASDFRRWNAYQSMINLMYQVVRAGEALTAASAQLFDLTVAHALPLRAICAEVYGGALAADKAAQVARINRIRTPGRVPAGTILKMPSRSS